MARPLFTGIACTVTAQETFEQRPPGPAGAPIDAMATRINTDGIKTTSGDCNLDELAERVSEYRPPPRPRRAPWPPSARSGLPSVPRWRTPKHWSACCAIQYRHRFGLRRTPAAERAPNDRGLPRRAPALLVTVLALATGFDVPDVDCILWLRPTQSPVLYVQGAGRGMRIADGKTDCLWLDFSDTTERLGPVDAIKKAARSAKAQRTRAHRL